MILWPDNQIVLTAASYYCCPTIARCWDCQSSSWTIIINKKKLSKRSWGYDHIMTKKTMKHASADVGFIFIAYNLKRILNIIGIDQLMSFLSSVFTLILTNRVKSIKNLLKTNLKYIFSINHLFRKSSDFYLRTLYF